MPTHFWLVCVCVCGVLKYCLYNFLKRPSVLEHERSARAVGTNRHMGTILHQIQADKVENILECSQDSIPSPTVKIQNMGGKVCLKCKGKTLLSVLNKLLKTKSLLTSPSNVLPYYLK